MLETVTPRALSWDPDGVPEALAAAVDVLKGASHVLVTGHENPDGDAISSTLGVALVCEALGLEVTRFNVDPVPVELRFLPGADRVVPTVATPPDVTVIVDCSSKPRVGGAFPDAGWGGTIVCLDHHRTVDRDFPDVLVHDEQAAATAELVYRLAVAAGVPLTPELARCLFAGMHTDTGSFRYDATTWRAMEVSAALLRTGISVWDIASNLYENQPEARVRLLGEALRGMERSPCGRLAVIAVTPEMFASSGATEDLADGFVNHARSIRGVEIAAQVTDIGGEPCRVSLRSRGTMDVSAIAARFGGGGHRNAAGFRVEGTAAEVREQLFEALIAAFDAP